MLQIFRNFEDSKFNDLRLLNYGMEECSPGHSFGPYIRDYYLMHYVCSGKGTYTLNGKEFSIERDRVFIIPPGEVTVYSADDQNPWTYMWIGISGIAIEEYMKMAGFKKSNPIIKASKKLKSILKTIIDKSEEQGYNSLPVTGNLYFFIDELIKCGGGSEKRKSVAQTYVENAILYINNNIQNKLTVSEIADYIGVNRVYFCNIFKKIMGCTPQSYILNLKIEKAKMFLEETNNEIRFIANSLGYDDPFVFSHAFTKKTGVSPKNWRNKTK
ncbi:MAG: AraC family transcriptional regulator [Clostridia bacterium]|nr:AraC family transcriptional regulator [Clostridia bacterium]